MPAVQPTGNTRSAPYHNPLRHVAGLIAERIDQGVDYSGTGPVYALGPGVIVTATPADPGWSGGLIVERLSDGPDKGAYVYWAEGVRPTVQVGDKVNWSTKVADMNGGIETGWSSGPDGVSLAHAQGHYSFPTPEGENFNHLMVSLGARSGTGPGAGRTGSGPHGGGVTTTGETGPSGTCLVGFSGSVPILLFYHQSFNACILSKSQGRAIAGTGLYLAGALTVLFGLSLLTVIAVAKAAGPVAQLAIQARAPGQAASAIRTTASRYQRTPAPAAGQAAAAAELLRTPPAVSGAAAGILFKLEIREVS
jgi:hypothetical protein